MANFSKIYITDAGKQLLNQKLYSQEELLFTEMAMSEREYDTALENLTELEGVRQRVGIRKMSKEGNAVQIQSIFLNSDLEEGYFANTLGIYARLGEEAPVLFAVAAEQTRAAFMPQKSRTLSGMEIRLKITLENTDHITIQMDQSAMATVGDVLELDRVIGTKANQAEVDNHTGNSTIHITASERQTWNGKQTMTGDTKDNIVSFTSGDSANPTGWTDVDLITSGEKHNSLWRKFSLFTKNVRYLWKLLGGTPLSGIGDGTVTGAISALNTGLVNIGIDLLHEGIFIEGSITPSKPATNYQFLSFSNNFGGSAVVKTVYGTIQAALTYNANNAIYTDVFTFAVNPQTISIYLKRRMVTSDGGTDYYDNSAEAITAIYGIKI